MEDFRREPYRDLVKRIADSPLIVEGQGAAAGSISSRAPFAGTAARIGV